MKKRWDKTEDLIVCKCYLNSVSTLTIISLFKKYGFERTYNSIAAKKSNYRYLDTGYGYKGYSNQAMQVYIEVTGNQFPHIRKKKGGKH